MWSDKEKGQTLLIVVLVMVVSLTVGLAAVSRSITNLRTSTEEASSQAAFSAAEAGVESLIKSTEFTATGIFTESNSSFNASATSIAGTEFLLNGGNPIAQDDQADIWLVSHNLNGTLNLLSGWRLLTGDAKLTLYWGFSGNACSNAALEIIAISGSSTAPISTRYALDPCASRRSTNHFEEPDSGNYPVKGKNFFYRTTIDIRNDSKGFVVRVVPLYAPTPIGIKGCNKTVNPDSPSCNALPSQGSIISSTGTSGTTSRKITVFQGYPTLPSEFFQYVLFSPH